MEMMSEAVLDDMMDFGAEEEDNLSLEAEAIFEEATGMNF